MTTPNTPRYHPNLEFNQEKVDAQKNVQDILKNIDIRNFPENVQQIFSQIVEKVKILGENTPKSAVEILEKLANNQTPSNISLDNIQKILHS